MKKILIVAKDELIRKSLSLVCKSLKLRPVVADHDKALSLFLSEEPGIAIVCDYDEKSERDFKGAETYKDLRNSATSEIILRCGFGRYAHADYLQLPFTLEELKKKIKGGVR